MDEVVVWWLFAKSSCQTTPTILKPCLEDYLLRFSWTDMDHPNPFDKVANQINVDQGW